MRTRIERITPQLAGKYLIKNIKNRPISPEAVRKYASEMAKGSFKETGDSIKFDTNGYLLDGQHRLQAIIDSKTAHNFIVVENLEPDSFDCMDIGRKRGSADCLAILKCKNSARTAAILRMLYLIRKYKQISTQAVKSHGAIPNHEIIHLYEQNRDVEQFSSLFGQPYRDILKFTGAGILGLFYDQWMRNPDSVLDFFTKLSKGTNLPENHPILYLRNYLYKDYISNTKLPIGLKFWLVVKIWHDYMEGRDFRKQVILPEYSSTSLIPIVGW
jgi:hypothetical protein